MSDENLDWIFVNMVPLLCNKIRIAKQQKIETWLRLYQAAAELGLQKPNYGTPRSDYVV